MGWWRFWPGLSRVPQAEELAWLDAAGGGAVTAFAQVASWAAIPMVQLLSPLVLGLTWSRAGCWWRPGSVRGAHCAWDPGRGAIVRWALWWRRRSGRLDTARSGAATSRPPDRASRAAGSGAPVAVLVPAASPVALADSVSSVVAGIWASRPRAGRSVSSPAGGRSAQQPAVAPTGQPGAVRGRSAGQVQRRRRWCQCAGCSATWRRNQGLTTYLLVTTSSNGAASYIIQTWQARDVAGRFSAAAIRS